jgi:nicotinamide-nucleotide amidase
MCARRCPVTCRGMCARRCPDACPRTFRGTCGRAPSVRAPAPAAAPARRCRQRSLRGEASSGKRALRRSVQIAVVLVGDELLAGHTRDANGHFLAQRMTALGHRVRRIAIVPDEPKSMVDEVDFCLRLADLVLVSGGLGPTHDDRTTEVLAERFHRRLVVDEPSWQRLVDRYGKRFKDGIPPATAEAARKMVTVPEGAEVLENPAGAAPGYLLHEGDRLVAVLPGVPAELQAIFESSIVGRLVPQATPPTLTELQVLMPEASFAHSLGAVADEFPDVEIGSYPHYGEKHVTLRFRGEPARVQAAVASFYARVPEARP